MTRALRNQVTDLRGASRLAIDAVTGVTGIVESLHGNIARTPTSLAGPVGAAVNPSASAVYGSIRGVTRGIGWTLDVALGAVAPALGHVESSPARDNFVSALNGVSGDRLVETGNPLAITAQLRCGGRALELTRDALAAAVPDASPKVLVLVPGLCMSDLRWNRGSHDHGRALSRDLGYSAVHLRYNSGLHISTNGRALAELLEALVASWPVPVEELAILGHSMGGLVARSAHHAATQAGHGWPRRLRKIVFLGTPHHGAPLERGGHWLHLLLGMTPWTAPFTRLGQVRSAGITDLRHGFVLDEDWHGHDRFAHRPDPRRPLPLPEGVRCYAVAGSTAASPGELRHRLVGDGLVGVASALGRHRDPRLTLGFPESRRWTAHGTGHLGLLSSLEVYERIRSWLAE